VRIFNRRACCITRCHIKVCIHQVGSVTADNASNVLACFKKEATLPVQGDELSGESENEDSECSDDTDDEESEGENEEHQSNTTDLVASSINEWGNLKVDRIGCMAHLIQLAVKDAISSSSYVKNLDNRLKEIVGFFRKSNHWYTKLRKMTSNIGVVQPGTTRWNSSYHSLKRLVGTGRVRLQNMRACYASLPKCEV
jgi:hypothetical protein